MWLIAGLGNPGRKYERNRHNIGFRVVTELASRHGLGEFRDKFGGQLASGMLSIDGRRHKALVLMPTQFMNRSGFAIVRTCQFYDIAAEDLIVVHDEIDIELGRLKLKSGGGHGGHNGLRSIIAELGSRDFLRVRVGVGKPGPPPGSAAEASMGARDQRIAGHVLSNFPSALDAEVDQLVRRSADAVEAIMSQGIRAAMNAFHAPKEPKRPAKPKAEKQSRQSRSSDRPDSRPSDRPATAKTPENPPEDRSSTRQEGPKKANNLPPTK